MTGTNLFRYCTYGICVLKMKLYLGKSSSGYSFDTTKHNFFQEMIPMIQPFSHGHNVMRKKNKIFQLIANEMKPAHFLLRR